VTAGNESPVNRLDQAEQLLNQTQAQKALEIAQAALATATEQARTLLICAEAYAQMRSAADAESAYRRALELEPSSVRGVVGLARLLHSADRNDEALALLQVLLTTQPSQIDAIVLMCDVLGTLGRVGEAGAWLDAAQTHAPANPRLQVLRGDWLIRCGKSEEGVTHLRDLLAGNPNRPLAWLTLTREAEARNDQEEALHLVGKAVAACPDVFWLWRRQLLMLAAADRQTELAVAIDSRAAPAVGQQDAFLTWARLMWHLDESARVRTALERADASEHEALADTQAGAQLLTDLARDGGDPLQAFHWLQQALDRHPSDTGLLRQVFQVALLAGEVDLAGEIASRVHQTDPQNRSGLELFILREARIFPDAMRRIREAIHGDPAERLHTLSRIVLEEPGCLPSAMAWLDQFAATNARSTPQEVQSAIPRILYHAEDPTTPWQERHRDYRWIDLRDPRHSSAARGLLPQAAERVFMRHPPETRMDILRLASLKANGGWWVNPTGPCSAPVNRLMTAGARLVVCRNDRGFLIPALIGCAAGHEAISAALDIALTALHEPPRPDSSPVTTGTPALTIGVAIAVSRHLLNATGSHDVAVISARKRDRLIGREWPK